MYFINLFVCPATLNLSLKQWFLLQLQRVMRWNITGNKPFLIQHKLDVLLLFFYFQELEFVRSKWDLAWHKTWALNAAGSDFLTMHSWNPLMLVWELHSQFLRNIIQICFLQEIHFLPCTQMCLLMNAASGHPSFPSSELHPPCSWEFSEPWGSSGAGLCSVGSCLCKQCLQKLLLTPQTEQQGGISPDNSSWMFLPWQSGRFGKPEQSCEEGQDEMLLQITQLPLLEVQTREWQPSKKPIEQKPTPNHGTFHPHWWLHNCWALM